ncbi:MAG: glycoside hydrolase family 15 protein [Planctomycetaceae bacterium]
MSRTGDGHGGLRSGAFTPKAHGGGLFPPIGEYAFLSDRETTALVAPTGDVEWLCVPRPDGPSVFGSLLDRGAGSFLVAPLDERVPAGRRYLPGTNVLETTWQTRTGWLLVQDALVVGPWYEDRRDRDYRRPPEDFRAEMTLLRSVECINGVVDVGLSCEPVFGYGRLDATWSYGDAGYGDAVARGAEDDPELQLVTDFRLGIEGRRATAQTQLDEGERRFVALSWGQPDLVPTSAQEALERLEATSGFWRGWLMHGGFPDHPWRGYLQRSALVLKGLQYAPTGALMAAATTSLPEDPGGERNWDYRYSWVRDATFALWSLYTLGFVHEARSFFDFVRDRIRGGGVLQVMYGIGGETDLQERDLDHLTGYGHAAPVRIGNAAFEQEQHDVWGALLDSYWLHHRAGEYLSRDEWDDLVAQVERAIDGWRDPDRGIWEVRGEPQHFTSSKIMCWVALDRASLLAEAMDHADLSADWRKVADEIRADVLEHGVNADGALTQTYGGEALDASNLLAILLRFLMPDDERARATVLAIADGLTRDGLVLRYRTEETDDGLEGGEGAFTICSFWLVSALVEIGEVERAHVLCEKLLSYASPLGLYAEELDAATGRQLGNYPQAFTHLAQVNALLHLIRAESDDHPDSAPPAVG